MRLASFGLDIRILCDLPYSILLLNMVLGIDFLGLALYRPQVLLLLLYAIYAILGMQVLQFITC